MNGHTGAMALLIYASPQTEPAPDDELSDVDSVDPSVHAATASAAEATAVSSSG